MQEQDLPKVGESKSEAANIPQWSSRHPESPKSTTHLGPDHPKVKFLAMVTLVIVALGGGFLGGWLGQRSENGSPSVEKQQVILQSQSELIRNIAKTVGESVVSVNTTTTVNRGQSFFFGGSGVQEGAGTGIILTDKGLIVTNRHVVPAGTTKVSVTLADGTELEDVRVVGRTSENDSLDVAFLQINDLKGKTLKPAKIGDSSKMQVGDAVVAIGNALGQFQNTVTSGIISGYGRSVQTTDEDGTGSDNLEDLFQTDAAINQGNSGGPLVNLNGEVIGINTAVAGNAENIGFSIPINDMSGLIDSVKQTGNLQRPYIGVVYIPLTNDVAKEYELSVTRGAYIPPNDVVGSESIIADGPAAKAGLKSGDIITKIDNQAIDQNNSLAALVNKHRVGDKVTLTLLRDGKEMKLDVTLGAAPTG
jgi:serine protease Do